MHELRPPTAASPEDADGLGHGELRILTRSPHPYSRLQHELLEPAEGIVYGPSTTAREHLSRPCQTKESTPAASDSGTEADNEHFLKRLPAPKTKTHKGLRGMHELSSGLSTPALTPAGLEEDGMGRALLGGINERRKRTVAERSRRRKEVVRRCTEVSLLVCEGVVVGCNHSARQFLNVYKTEITSVGTLFVALLVLYPLRVATWAYRQRTRPARTVPVSVPATFDPAPILYPPIVPVLVSLLTAANAKAVVLPNLMLSICAMPRWLIPTSQTLETYDSVHWILSCIPLFACEMVKQDAFQRDEVPCEVLVLLYPLHQTSCLIIHYLTTTSLLTAELQLLTISFINVLLLASSPQALILKALLWGGGLGLIVLSGPVIRWAISLARVPKWRFRRVTAESKMSSPLLGLWSPPSSMRRLKRELLGTSEFDDPSSGNSSEAYEKQTTTAVLLKRRRTESIGSDLPNRKTHTPSGRRKRSASLSLRAFFSLTQQQANMRTWLYAGYVYLCIAVVILMGIRVYVQEHVLYGVEPVGWALGYLFGHLPWFRFEVVKANLERWIHLPPRIEPGHSCHMGWVQLVRREWFGEANTRLLMCAYCVVIIIMGLAVVFRLSPIYEVDTRRKVFHFMMVAMFLPSIFVDPAFVALALSLMLAIFLLLDMLRASQLPPLSKPIATFLTPFVDGRDLRGPVVISHIFLLIGCAIPLWLSLAALPRQPVFASSPLATLPGWELPTRDLSMVSGVVCVGLGDAAASLIGRRWGHRKWLWGGGKSLEGSLAFATAVFAGLMAARLWLSLGRWPVTAAADDPLASSSSSSSSSSSLSFFGSWAVAVPRSGLCAVLASLTEAVLTGGNDNVVVPVVLWTCVKATGL